MSDKDLPVNQIRDFKGVWIPYKLIEKLTPDFRIIFSVVDHYYFKKCIDNSTWKTLLTLSLAKKHSFSAEEIKAFISCKSPQQILSMPAFQICSWCKANTYRLHSHHFPVSKKDGGTCTVEICASCHDEYHFMNECFYSFTDEVYAWFKGGNNE